MRAWAGYVVWPSHWYNLRSSTTFCIQRTNTLLSIPSQPSPFLATTLASKNMFDGSSVLVGDWREISGREGGAGKPNPVLGLKIWDGTCIGREYRSLSALRIYLKKSLVDHDRASEWKKLTRPRVGGYPFVEKSIPSSNLVEPLLCLPFQVRRCRGYYPYWYNPKVSSISER